MEVEVRMRPAVDIPTGSYKGQIVDIKEREIQTGDKRRPTAVYAIFVVKLTDEKLPKDAIGYTLEYSLPGRVTPNSGLNKFLKKANVKIPEGVESFDLSPLKNRNVIVFVGKREWERGGASGVAPDIRDIEFVNR